MIKSVFCALGDIAESTGVFGAVYEYVELVNTATGVVVPRYYQGGYKDVQNFEKNGVVYFRLNGEVGQSADTKTRTATPCDGGLNQIYSIPVRAVAAVLREKLPDPRFADIALAETLDQALQAGISLPETVTSTDIQVSRFSVDGFKIWAEENRGKQYREDVLFKYAYVSLDLTVTVRANINCLTTCREY